MSFAGQQNVGPAVGRPASVVMSGTPTYKTAGLRLNWAATAAVGADTVIPGTGQTVPAGKKYFRYGVVLCKITGAGQGGVIGEYAPYLAGATDGRQTLTPGSCYIIDDTVILGGSLGLGSMFDEVPANVFNRGCEVYGNRIASDGTNGPAANPTKAQLATAFPNLVFNYDHP